MLAAGLLIAALSLVEYYLISGSGPLPTGSNILIFGVINLNILLILLLSFLIVRNLVKLVFEDKKNILGAKLRTKLVIAFVSLSLLPTMLLFLVSFQFLKTSLTYWFDIKVERALDNALTVGRTYYQDRIFQLQQLGREMGRTVSLRCVSDAGSIDRACVEQWVSPAPLLSKTPMSNAAPLNSVEIIEPTRETLLIKTWLPLVGTPPEIPPSVLAKAMKEPKPLVYSSTLENGALLRVLCPLKGADNEVLAILALGNLIPQDIGHLLDEIRMGYEDYSQLILYQNPIRATLLTTLFLITLLILFVAIWFGFRLARGITEPVRMLAEATHRVAHGDLDFSLEAHGRDELSSLLRAFNTMTQDLKEARRRAGAASRELRKSYEEIEQRRRYMEIILQNVAAGVISLDRQGIITTVNRSAEAILGISAGEVIGRPYHQLLTKEQAEEFDVIRQELAISSKGTLQRPMRLVTGDKSLSLLMNFTVLRDQDNRSLGVVVVFDDLTELEKIQRIAAWREVARRIAHEVKNPLTPIQLSAQRLRKKYLGQLKNGPKDVFDKCTGTIIGQVEELKRLVNEFSDFARMPAPRFRPSRMDSLAEEVLVIYRIGHPETKFHLEVQEDMPVAAIDPDQVKRVIINLLDNAVASMEKGGGEVFIRLGFSTESKEIRLEVADTGTGVSPEDRPRLFEPYFSKRKGGTGLGLAIVNSVVADHNGRISVEENRPRGTKFIIILPIEQNKG
jgi:two-component system nitrogen regulation sensor histidine kinase NtrY